MVNLVLTKKRIILNIWYFLFQSVSNPGGRHREIEWSLGVNIRVLVFPSPNCSFMASVYVQMSQTTQISHLCPIWGSQKSIWWDKFISCKKLLFSGSLLSFRAASRARWLGRTARTRQWPPSGCFRLCRRRTTQTLWLLDDLWDKRLGWDGRKFESLTFKSSSPQVN